MYSQNLLPLSVENSAISRGWGAYAHHVLGGVITQVTRHAVQVVLHSFRFPCGPKGTRRLWAHTSQVKLTRWPEQVMMPEGPPADGQRAPPTAQEEGVKTIAVEGDHDSAAVPLSHVLGVSDLECRIEEPLQHCARHLFPLSVPHM
jgi:hypothetical protein